MKVKAIQFVPLGRPPKKGEYGRWKKHVEDAEGWEALFFMASVDIVDSRCEGFTMETHCVEVPDPVPDWIVDALAPLPYEHLKNVAAAFRSLVDERAKAAAERMENVSEFTRTVIGQIIRECFLEGR